VCEDNRGMCECVAWRSVRYLPVPSRMCVCEIWCVYEYEYEAVCLPGAITQLVHVMHVLRVP